MKPASWLLLILIVAGMALTVTAFMNNLSPYVKVSAALNGKKNVHVPLKPILETIHLDIKTMTLTFEGKDETGTMKVIYPKGKPNNFEAASQVVVVGSYENGAFQAHEMLVKCPSKYQGEEQAQR